MLFGELLDNWGEARRNPGWMRALVYVALAAALVLVGPFDTGSDPWLWRVIYWLLMVAIFDRLLVPCAIAVVKRAPLLAALPFAVGLVLLPLFLSILTTVVVVVGDFVAYLFACQSSVRFPDRFQAQIVEACAVTASTGPFETYGNVLALCVLTGGLLFLCTGGMKAFMQPAVTGPKPGLRFLSRLPANIGSELRYVQMQDHYLRIVTSGGEAMILLSMRDALAELEGVNGMQVHRSWWVSLSDVEQIVRDGRKTIAIMSDGTRIPVSETYRAALKERAGLTG